MTYSSLSYTVARRSLSQERQRLVQGEQEAAAKEEEGKVDDLGFEHATLDRPRMERGGRRRPKSHRINRGALAEALAVREGEGQWQCWGDGCCGVYVFGLCVAWNAGRVARNVCVA